jgi:hypothetical protein
MSLNNILEQVEGVEVQLHTLSLAADEDEWSASCPSHFMPGTDPKYHWIGGWLGPRFSLDVVLKKGKSLPLPGTKPPDVQPIVSHFSY